MFNLIKQQLGNEYYIYFSLIFTIFYGILFFNLLSLLPFGFALTSHILLMLYISLSLGLGIFLIGINKHGLNFF
jgi:F0F1-type ATP synthase membrane subunit a